MTLWMVRRSMGMEREREGVVGIWLGVLVVVRIGWRWIGVIIPRGSCAVLDMPAGHCTESVVTS